MREGQRETILRDVQCAAALLADDLPIHDHEFDAILVNGCALQGSAIFPQAAGAVV